MSLDYVEDLVGFEETDPVKREINALLSAQFHQEVKSTKPVVLMHPDEIGMSEEQRFKFQQKMRDKLK